MIFFVTLIVPSSDIDVELKKTQTFLFRQYNLAPSPFPLLISAIEIKKPVRPTRSHISRLFPPVIHLQDYYILKGTLTIPVREQIPFSIDDNLIMDTNLLRGNCIMGSIENPPLSFTEWPVLNKRKFSNYSLAAYEISSGETELFWKNMSWKKIWEVKKGKL